MQWIDTQVCVLYKNYILGNTIKHIWLWRWNRNWLREQQFRTGFSFSFLRVLFIYLFIHLFCILEQLTWVSASQYWERKSSNDASSGDRITILYGDKDHNQILRRGDLQAIIQNNIHKCCKNKKKVEIERNLHIRCYKIMWYIITFRSVYHPKALVNSRFNKLKQYASSIMM